MQSYPGKEHELCPQLLDLIPKNREWIVKREEGEGIHGSGPSEEIKKLELRLGPPDGEWTIKDSSRNVSTEKDNSFLLSCGYFSNNNTTSGAKRGFQETVNRNQTQTQTPSSWQCPGYQGKAQQTKGSSFIHQQLPVMAKESSQLCCTKAVDLQGSEKKAFSPPSANTAVPTSAQKRTAPSPVVGWPPVRSFRKNLASNSATKAVSESHNVVQNEKPIENCHKGFFVKINMDGIPIGRKVDLNAYDNYDKLSSAVDQLFKGLLAAQSEVTAAGGSQKEAGDDKAITGLLDGSGEYTLVYEDNEGDRMLVGDVPWHMFVSTVKRLRVLKSSELSTLCGSNKHIKA